MINDICEKCLHNEICKYTGLVIEIIDKSEEIDNLLKSSPLELRLECTYYTTSSPTYRFYNSETIPCSTVKFEKGE